LKSSTSGNYGGKHHLFHILETQIWTSFLGTPIYFEWTKTGNCVLQQILKKLWNVFLAGRIEKITSFGDETYE
jgi:hypothetical protein